MAFRGYDFDLEEIVPLEHSRSLVSTNPYPRIGNGMAVTTSGMTLTVAAGYGIFMGKYIYNDASYTITVPSSFSGVLAFKFDLTQTNTATGTGSSRVVTNNQLSLVLQPVATFPIAWNSLGDINNGDTIGYCPIGKVTSTTTAVTYTSYFDTAGTYTSRIIQNFVTTYPNVNSIIYRKNNLLNVQVESSSAIDANTAAEYITIPVGFQPMAQDYTAGWNPLVIPSLIPSPGNVLFITRERLRVWVAVATSQLISNGTFITTDPFMIY